MIKPTPATYGATQVPASSYDAGPDLYFLQRWNPDDAGTGYLRIYQLSGNVGLETLTPLGYPSAPAWSESALGRVDFAPQGPSCGGAKIQTNDSRIQNVVQRNGKLWATHTVFYPPGGTPTRASVQWWQVQTDATVLQRGLVDDPWQHSLLRVPQHRREQERGRDAGLLELRGRRVRKRALHLSPGDRRPDTMQTPSVLKAARPATSRTAAPAGTAGATTARPSWTRSTTERCGRFRSTRRRRRDYLGAPALNRLGHLVGHAGPDAGPLHRGRDGGRGRRRHDDAQVRPGPLHPDVPARGRPVGDDGRHRDAPRTTTTSAPAAPSPSLPERPRRRSTSS